MEFAGQTAIVTGVARGFGRAIVRRLARGGARVVAGDINLPGAEETVALVKQDGGEATAFHLDVSSDADKLLRWLSDSYADFDQLYACFLANLPVPFCRVVIPSSLPINNSHNRR